MLACYVLRVLLDAALCSAEFCSPCTSGLLSWCDRYVSYVMLWFHRVFLCAYTQSRWNCTKLQMKNGIKLHTKCSLYIIFTSVNMTLQMLRVVYKAHMRNAWTVLVFCLAGVSPIVSEHRKQIDDLKKFKNDFRVSFSVNLIVSKFLAELRLL